MKLYSDKWNREWPRPKKCHMWTVRSHMKSPPPTHTKTTFRPSSPTTLHHADFSHTSPTTLQNMSAPFALQHGQKTLYPLLLSTIPSSVFLSMLSVTPTGLKWSISGVEGQTLDSGAMITSLEAGPARHIALRVTWLFWDGPYAAYSTHLETLINLLFYLKQQVVYCF